LFTGKTPFSDELEYAIFQKITHDDPIIPPEIPEEAASLIKLLLTKDPN